MSQAVYLALVLDLTDPQGHPVTVGSVTLVPSSYLVDQPDMMTIPPQPVTVELDPGGRPVAGPLLASDSPGPLAAGWTWDISFSVAGAGIPSYSLFLPAGPAAFTSAPGSPAVFTWSPAGSQPWQLQALPNGTGVQLSGGSLPAGFSPGVTYFVVNASGDTVQLAASQGGPPMGSGAGGSGSLTVVQYQLSALSPVESVMAMSGFLALPSGTASVGQVPVATGNGTSTRWGNGTGDKNYTQPFTAASSVTVTHNLQKYPAVTVMDTAGDEVDGDVDHQGVNSLTVTFSAPFSGTVTCN